MSEFGRGSAGLTLRHPGTALVMAQSTVKVFLTGKLGTNVYTPNRQGTGVRMLVTPRNPQTAEQTAQRSIIANVASAWRGLTAANRASWQTLVAAFPNNLSPFNIWVKVNAVLTELGQATLDDAPAMPSFTALTFSSAFSVENTAGVLSMGLTPVMAPAPDFYLYYASRPHSAGISGAVALNLIGNSTGAAPLSDAALSTAYSDKFGVPALGTRIVMQVVPVKSGIKGAAPVHEAITSTP